MSTGLPFLSKNLASLASHLLSNIQVMFLNAYSVDKKQIRNDLIKVMSKRPLRQMSALFLISEFNEHVRAPL